MMISKSRGTGDFFSNTLPEVRTRATPVKMSIEIEDEHVGDARLLAYSNADNGMSLNHHAKHRLDNRKTEETLSSPGAGTRLL